MKERIFHTLGERKTVDLIPYLKKKVSERDDIKIYIGTDSQNHKKKTFYAVVIVLHYGNNGGHVIYTKEKVPRIKDRYSRLWREVTLSLELANFIVDNGIQRPDFIDLDLNPDPKWKSNDVLRAALGYVEGSGYTPRAKHGEVSGSASWMADKLCR